MYHHDAEFGRVELVVVAEFARGLIGEFVWFVFGDGRGRTGRLERFGAFVFENDRVAGADGKDGRAEAVIRVDDLFDLRNARGGRGGRGSLEGSFGGRNGKSFVFGVLRPEETGRGDNHRDNEDNEIVDFFHRINF
jgi:hypothetical protein